MNMLQRAERILLEGFRARRLWSHLVDLDAVCYEFGCTIHGLLSTLAARGWSVRGCAHSDVGYLLRAPVERPWEDDVFTCPECGIVCSGEWGNDATDLCSVCATRDLVTVAESEEINPRRGHRAFDAWLNGGSKC